MTHDLQVAGRKRPRIASLDVTRGLMLVASVGTDSIVTPPWWSQHAAWEGVTPLDVIFPIFVTLTGCGIAFAYARGIQSPWRLVRRVVVLLLAGLVYNAVTSGTWDLSTWRMFGVLQLYAVVILVVSLLHLVARSVRAWAAIVVLLAAALVVVHAAWGIACGAVTPVCNPSLDLDLQQRWVAHVYQQGAAGHDPEGVVAILGATLQASVGALFGHLILRARDHGWALPRTLAVGTVVAAAVALLAAVAIVVPQLLGAEPMLVMKRLWTPPFALLVGAATGLVLVLAFLVIDRGSDDARHRRLRPLEPFLALGRNSLLVYFGSHALNAVLHRQPWFASVVGTSAEWWLPIGMIVAWTLLAVVLNRRRIYVRA
ncbi:heparan-alpha-glucosaminide N-acetyltransferase domain-containing protein [Agrococcus sp. SGAir0287]|uniref:heparan-alpha-glucosaminide N-acetyltransferase domain-containing protein n=1 Tax=Agrococcus sp. SGAir0287 TaxID=2070347 RepID=UPI0010CCCD4D|nr:heparan-alpha-glucosaminide N-acetyltransferase domain-containing protein [Agrococcus sp. SGAir0287]QCR18658.1 heparan-alpha-glucosaminide N-acetyltransferase [Agrococcus sp. SGAir0287]